MIDSLSGAYLEALEEAYRQDPQSVSSDWQQLLLTPIRPFSTTPSSLTPPVPAPAINREDGGYVQLDPLGLAKPYWFRLHTESTALELDHISDPTKRAWLEEHSKLKPSELMDEDDIQKALYRAYAFETFLHRKYPGAKRFGLDGGETLLIALEAVVRHSAKQGVKDLIVGMAHRGRLCVLANMFKQPLEEIIRQFEGQPLYCADELHGSGDVKYHAGYSSDRILGESQIHLSLLPNPSHLESVTPVVLGKVRAKQARHGSRESAIGVIMHGDAAFSGQGVVMEALQLARLPGYETGGTVHIVIDNQIGFTTLPSDGRSTPFPTDIAKMMEVPVWHIQGDGESTNTLHAIQSALNYRATFGSDVIIHWVCYRRHGHNEGDEPEYTQPNMYQAISKRPALSIEIKDEIRQDIDKELDDAWQNVQKSVMCKSPDWLQGNWSNILPEAPSAEPVQSGISLGIWKQVEAALHTHPKGFTVHPKLTKWLSARQQNMDRGTHIDWATAEAIAFGSLLLEGYPVRLSGQDVSRGTFTQRHAALFDYQTNAKWIGLQSLGSFELINSSLSEMAVLGFEYGYSTASPQSLVLWEAQFGDFANGAQIIIDQFISSAQTKWMRLSGLVLLLPHGFEGQGPEHSSARLERFLELSAENNWRVINCTTPANYFHALRRQMLEKDRKPLVVMTPKSLLRHKRCVSAWGDFAQEARFQPLILDPFVPLEAAERIILCQGKVYYDLLEQRDVEQAYNVAIVRLEQLYPLPEIDLPEKAEQIWCQEEPNNMGAWPFLCRQKGDIWKRVHYVGRAASSSPATGLNSQHQFEQKTLLKEAIKGVIA